MKRIDADGILYFVFIRRWGAIASTVTAVVHLFLSAWHSSKTCSTGVVSKDKIHTQNTRKEKRRKLNILRKQKCRYCSNYMEGLVAVL